MAPTATVTLSLDRARAIWLRAQRLDTREPFGRGAAATPAAIQHLGYVQIDTIHVIERCHHHILFTRIPSYRPAHLHQAQAVDKSVFEYWTHALAYLPVADFPFFVALMRDHRREATQWGALSTAAEVRRVVERIRRNGPLTIRDIDDSVRLVKDSLWASTKPSKHALQRAFFNGQLVVSERRGMVKTYELTTRHFGWQRLPPGTSEREYAIYMVDRALRAQGVVSLDSVCHLERSRKAAVLRVLAGRTRRGALVPVKLEGSDRADHWATPDVLETPWEPSSLVHLLSPFDPLVIQRRRLERFFGYTHLFEAYVPAARRKLGYFALPVLVGDRIAAAIDLKTDRERGRLLIQRWTWVRKRQKGDKARIDDALHTFEHFQCGRFAEDS